MSNVDASPATRKVYECMLLVEACGASDELTAAINALGELDAMLQAEARGAAGTGDETALIAEARSYERLYEANQRDYGGIPDPIGALFGRLVESLESVARDRARQEAENAENEAQLREALGHANGQIEAFADTPCENEEHQSALARIEKVNALADNLNVVADRLYRENDFVHIIYGKIATDLVTILHGDSNG